jgi:hypothetical protein
LKGDKNKHGDATEKKHKGRNPNHDTNKRRKTRSQRYSEGGIVKKTNVQIETRNHVGQEE